MQIAIIDDYISAELVLNLTGIRIHAVSVKEISGNTYTKKWLTHGTVCAALVAEFAPHADIYGISAYTQESQDEINALLLALEWCINKHFELVCLSCGTTNWLDGQKMIYATQRLAYSGSKIISATSPSQFLTFPACFPWVIGVSCDTNDDSMVKICSKKMGYDIQIGHFHSIVLDRLSFTDSFYKERTSSMAVPYVAGLFSQKFDFMHQKRIKDYLEDMEENPFRSLVPFVRVIGGSVHRCVELLNLFHINQYMAILLSDSFETDWSQLTVKIENISEYNQILSVGGGANIILVYIKNEALLPSSWDYCVNMDIHSVTKCYADILTFFCDERN